MHPQLYRMLLNFSLHSVCPLLGGSAVPPWWKRSYFDKLPCDSFNYIVCTWYIIYRSFANCTAWKWGLEKKNLGLVPEHVSYALTRSFSHENHHCGHDSLSPIAIYTVTGNQVNCLVFYRAMWDNSVQDSYPELSDQTLSNPTSSSLLSPPYRRSV